MLTVSLTLHVVLAATELDDAHLVGAAVGHDLGGDRGALQRIAQLDAIAIAQHQDGVELDLVASFDFELFHAERFALRDAVLLTAGYQNCVHDQVFLCSYYGRLTCPWGRQERNCTGLAGFGSSRKQSGRDPPALGW